MTFAHTAPPRETSVLQLLKERSLFAYWSDRFNRVDLPAAAFSLAALACMYIDFAESDYGRAGPLEFTPRTRSLRSLAVMLCWMRVPRFFLLSTRRGPLVLMLFKMMDDVLSFIYIRACSCDRSRPPTASRAAKTRPTL